MSNEQLEEYLFAMVHDEEFDTACVVNPDTEDVCPQWNKSASYCMKRSAASCPKVIRILSIVRQAR